MKLLTLVSSEVAFHTNHESTKMPYHPKDRAHNNARKRALSRLAKQREMS